MCSGRSCLYSDCRLLPHICKYLSGTRLKTRRFIVDKPDLRRSRLTGGEEAETRQSDKESLFLKITNNNWLIITIISVWGRISPTGGHQPPALNPPFSFLLCRTILITDRSVISQYRYGYIGRGHGGRGCRSIASGPGLLVSILASKRSLTSHGCNVNAFETTTAGSVRSRVTCSGEVVLPVPMAHTGSYAGTTLPQSFTFSATERQASITPPPT